MSSALEPLALLIKQAQHRHHQALDAALASSHGQAAATDFGKIAPPGSRILVQSLDD